MKRSFLVSLAAGLVMTAVLSGRAQDMGYWRAMDSSAKTITGDIILSEAKLSIGFSRFTIAQIRALKPAEASALFNADSSPGGGNLYRTIIPPDKRFLHHNTLCGSDETQWVATWGQGRNLQVAFFSGSGMPVLTAEALASSSSLCGTFSYTR